MKKTALILLLASPAYAQTKPPAPKPPGNVALVGTVSLDCDAATPPPVTLTSGASYNVAFCVPSVVSTPNGDVPNRVEGYKMQLDVNPSSDMQLPLGQPSPVLKLQPTYFTAPSGVAKGNHQWTITPYNFPLDANGVPDKTKPAQMGPAVVIPFVAADQLLSTAPPAVQKGQIVR